MTIITDSRTPVVTKGSYPIAVQYGTRQDLDDLARRAFAQNARFLAAVDAVDEQTEFSPPISGAELRARVLANRAAR